MRRREFVSLSASAAFMALADRPALSQPSSCAGSPGISDDGWDVTAPGDDTFVDDAALCRIADRLERRSDPKIHALLIAHRGKLVFERYFKGTDEIPGRLFGRRVAEVAFDAATRHDMKSVSKSVASLAMGIALDRGLVRSVDEPILSFFPDLSDLRSSDRDQIRLVHALTMTMGLDWVEATPQTGDFHNDEARMNMAFDPCRYVLSRQVMAPAGREFFYNTGALRLVSTILHKATGQHLDTFARSTLFEPLGIRDVVWERVRGETDAGGGLRLRPRDMAKIGQLVLDGGRWKGREIVPKSWIAASTTPKIGIPDGQSYGYLWWLGRYESRGGAVQAISALGRGGQAIRVVPDRDLVVAVTAGYYQDESDQAFEAQLGVFKDVLRAVGPAT